MLKHQVKENKSLYHTPSGVFHIAKQYFIAKLFHKSEGFISLKNDTVKTVSFFLVEARGVVLEFCKVFRNGSYVTLCKILRSPLKNAPPEHFSLRSTPILCPPKSIATSNDVAILFVYGLQKRYFRYYCV